jgi:hypothetical protein
MADDRPGIPPVKQKLLKLACGSCCERCSAYTPLARLTIRMFAGDGSALPSKKPDTARQILVLCPACDRIMKGLPAAGWEPVLKRRPRQVKREMRRILGYRPPPVDPPEQDIEALFADAFAPGAVDMYLNGA